MALSSDTQPHFGTIAGFISSMSEEIRVVFRDVLLVCDEMGLIVIVPFPKIEILKFG